MVYISKVYTRTGDEGETKLADGNKLRKDHARIRAYGEVDEVNACIGLVREAIGRDPNSAVNQPFAKLADRQLARIQHELFNLGAELATPGAATGTAKTVIEDRHVEELERDMDAFNEDLSPLTSFVLPGGGPSSAFTHLARTVCRRAERELVALAHADAVRPETLRYLNRLSDYLFVLSRAAASSLGYDEVLWDPKTT